MPWRALPHSCSRVVGCCSCAESLEALSLRQSSVHLYGSQELEIFIHSSAESLEELSLRQSSVHLYGSQELEIFIHSSNFEYETTKVVRVDQGLWARKSLSPGKGKCHCIQTKLQSSLQSSHGSTPHILLWSRRAKSSSYSTCYVDQHSPHSNYQGRFHCHSENGCSNGSHSDKIGATWSEVFLRTCWWSPMVQGSSCGPKRFWALLQDHGWSSLVLVFQPSENKQDVSRFEEEFLVDETEATDSKICGSIWHLSKS
jgi:hypothetical protein